MRYQDSTLQERLAAEYVMGNLTGQARRRFERLLLQYPELQACVANWSARLQPLNDEIAMVTPPSSVWTNIADRIDDSATTSPWQQRVFWRRVAAIAASLLLVFSLLIYFNHRSFNHVVVIRNQAAQTEWIVEAHARSRHVVVRTITPPVLPKDKVCILWLAWKDGNTRSIGTLSDKVGKTELPLPRDLKYKPELANVVVSVETRGVALDKPSGKIVFNGPWVRL